MIIVDMSTPEQILNLAQKYQPSSRHASLLEPYKEAVLLLRAKDASYESIATILNDNEVNVSAGTIRKFCLRHDAEIKRLCVQHQLKPDDSVANSRLSDSSPVSSSFTSMVSKPGPKIAREHF